MIFFSCLETSFSSLDGRKEAKEDQGVRDASQVFLVLQDLRDASQVGLVLQDLRDAGQVDYRTILATISLSSVRKAAAS